MFGLFAAFLLSALVIVLAHVAGHNSNIELGECSVMYGYVYDLLCCRCGQRGLGCLEG